MQSSVPTLFDKARLLRLIDLVGPDQAPEFLAQLDRDLADCDARIARGGPAGDWGALRDGSHVLTSLAGSAGALGLQDLAQRLNAVAHAQDSEGLADLGPRIAAELAALRSRLAAIAREGPSAP